MVIISAIAILFLVIGLTLLVGVFRTIYIQSSPNQAKFLKGTVPQKLNGYYKGHVNGFDWQGKKFDASHSAGINIFKEDKSEESFPFKTYPAKGLQDNIEVLRIDYSQNSDPWWLKFIVDELVEVSPGKYLGKIHIQIFRGLSFAVGYFNLEK